MPEQTYPTPGVPVKIGGRDFVLRYPASSMKQAREEFGGSITNFAIVRTIDETKIGKLLWYGTKANHPEVSVEELEDLFDYTQVEYVLTQYFKAVGISLPEKNEQSPSAVIQQLTELVTRAESLLEATRLTGSDSGPSGDTTSVSATASSGA